jgi:hypothetical protein
VLLSAVPACTPLADAVRQDLVAAVDLLLSRRGALAAA